MSIDIRLIGGGGGGGGAVTSVAGRTGAVTLTSADIGGLGTAAVLDVGTTALNVVQLDASAKLPAVDGSQLTNLPSAPVTSVAGKTGAVTLTASDISGLATVATTGAYSDLSGLPTLGTAAALDVGTTALNVVQLDASAKLPAVDGSQLTNLPSAPVTSVAGKTGAVTLSASDISGLATVATTGAYSDLSGTPSLATVATTGAYSDLSGLPTLGTAAALDVGTTALKVVQLDASGKLPAVDGSQLTNLPSAPVTSVAGKTGAVTLSASDISGLATVATSGAYSDLSGKPTLATVATSGAYADLSGTPSLATVATTGAYSDLSGLPTLGTAAALDVGTTALNVVQLDASAKLPAVDGSQLTNLPSAPVTSVAGRTGAVTLSASDISGLATVATSGAYADLSGTPSLATVATSGAYSDLSGLPTLGTAAALDVGTTALNVVQLDASAKLPAVDGSQLTNLPGAATALNDLTDVTISSVANGQSLVYNSATSQWINSSVTGNLIQVTSDSPSGTYTINSYTGTQEVYLLTLGANTVITLPSAATAGSGYVYIIKNLSSFTMTITPSSGTIDGSASFGSSVQFAAFTLVSNGSNWFVI